MATVATSVDKAFGHLVLDFLAYLELERGLSRNTLEAYRTDLIQYGTFLKGRGGDALSAEHGDVTAFLDQQARIFERQIAQAPDQWWAVFFPIWPDLEAPPR